MKSNVAFKHRQIVFNQLDEMNLSKNLTLLDETSDKERKKENKFHLKETRRRKFFVAAVVLSQKNFVYSSSSLPRLICLVKAA